MIDYIVDKLEQNKIVINEDREVYAYGLFVILFNITTLVSFIFISVLVGELQFTLKFLAFFIPIRILLGGYHCKSAKFCFIYSHVCFFIVLMFYKYLGQFYNLSIITMIIICMYKLYNDHKKTDKYLFGIIVFQIILSIYNGEYQNFLTNSFVLNEFLFILKEVSMLNKK